MAHNISAVVGDAAAIASAARQLGCSWVPLTPNVALIPMTDELFDSLATGDPSIAPFVTFTPSVLGHLRDALPRFGYVETEYFGGTGTQRAGAWDRERMLVAPREAPGSVVNEVLRALGVTAGDAHDEWDAIGLVRFRRMDDLRAAAHR
jgi:hypothetical protein